MSGVTLTDRSDEAIDAMSEAVEAALEAMGQQGSSYAKTNITKAGRVDTGALRNSMNHLAVPSEGAVYIGTNQDYAIYNELGTGIYLEGGGGRQTPWSYKDASGRWHTTNGIRPIHFLKNAIADNREKLLKIAAEIIKKRMT